MQNCFFCVVALRYQLIFGVCALINKQRCLSLWHFKLICAKNNLPLGSELISKQRKFHAYSRRDSLRWFAYPFHLKSNIH